MSNTSPIAQQQRLRHLNIQIARRLRTCLDLAEYHFNRSFPMPSVNFNLRGVKAGVAYLQQNEIRLNRTLLLENSEDFLQQVVPHELAHLIVYQYYGQVRPHGQEWQYVMQQLFQLPAHTCHQFDIQHVQGKTIHYRCNCQTHQLSLRRHHNIIRHKTQYRCRLCKSLLIAVG